MVVAFVGAHGLLLHDYTATHMKLEPIPPVFFLERRKSVTLLSWLELKERSSFLVTPDTLSTRVLALAGVLKEMGHTNTGAGAVVAGGGCQITR